MANNYEACLIGVMNRLWFHQIILFPEPTSLVLISQTLKPSKATSESHPYPSITEEAMSSLTHPQDDSNYESSDGEKIKPEESPENLNSTITRSRSSHSSSGLIKKRAKCLSNYSASSSTTGLLKTMSCKSLWELELEEVKGFRDLGFIFTKDSLSPRMMSVLPGLQRLGLTKFAAEDNETEDEEERGMMMMMMRPYLSEAWLIKKPDSPLLNLRIPRVCAAADMKKHIVNWARTVASVIHQQSSFRDQERD